MATPYWNNGKRFQATPDQSVDMDALARQNGQPDAATWQQTDPQGYNIAMSQHPQGGGDTQVANSDNLDAKKLGMLLGAEVGMGFLPGGAAWGGSAADLPSLSEMVTPFDAASLPAGTAASFGAVPAATGAAATTAGAPLMENAGGQFLHSGMFPASGDITAPGEMAGEMSPEEMAGVAPSSEGMGSFVDPTTPHTTAAGDLFTPSSSGGSSLARKLGSLATPIGAGMSAAARAAAEGRAQQQQANLGQDREDTIRTTAGGRQAVDAANTDLAQRKFASGQSQQDLHNALMGGLLQGTHDINFNLPERIASHMGAVTGGLRPSSLAGGADIGKNLQRQALMDLMDPSTANTGPYKAMNVTNGMTPPPSTLNFPTMRPQPTPSAGANILQYAGPLAAILGQYF